MNTDPLTPVLPLSGLPTILVVILALAALAGAIVLHLIPRLPSPARWGLVAANVLATYLAWWLIAIAASRWLLFTTSWPLGWWTLLGAVGTEVIVALYRFERAGASRLVGGTLLALRLCLLFIVLFWLTQPVLHKEWTIPVDRYVAVVIDDSASMKLTDADAPASEKLDLAQLFGVNIKDRPVDFRESQRKISDLESKLGSQLQVLELMSATDSGSGRQMEARFAKLKEMTTSGRELLAGVSKSLDRPGGDKLKLEAATTSLVTAMQGQIKAVVDGPLVRLDKLASTSGETQTAGITAAREDIRQAVDVLGRVREGLARLPVEMDGAFWQSLPAAQRQEIQSKTNVARAAIARRVLERKGEGENAQTIAEKLNDGYVLKFYHFASRPGAVAPETYVAKKKQPDSEGEATEKTAATDPKAKATVAKPAANGPAPPATDDVTPEANAWRSATDLAATLKQVDEDTPDGLSGVVVLWDGRHNADEPLQAWSDKFKSKRAPLFSVLIGSKQVPKDAAVAAMELPHAIMANDKVSVKASVKIDGYRGEDLVVRLMRGKDEVGRKTIKVPEDRHRTKVEFSDTAKQVGTYPYKVEILTAAGAPLKETVTVNDSVEKAVSVTDDRIKVLIVESQPRWDFRYLKNLFAGPDKLVHLQYVLTNPTRLADAPPPPLIRVSASRPFGQFEGTMLPENEKEWMKFDVIFLGDVAPSTLNKETIDLLDKFVFKRGGTLVVLGGADYMPHAYADTKLAEMLPMRTEKIDGSLRQGPEPGYRIRLTDEGKQHVVMKQLAGADTEEFWKTLPVMRWRHPKAKAKDGAVRLAYAESAYQEGARGIADQERLERDNCLICYHSYGAGKVMMLSFDESWRLRYRIGVANHHRFWGQVARWAADDKLQAGTALVRLGTDRPRYDVGQPVTIKTRLLNEKADPIENAEVEAKVFRGDKLVRTVKLEAKPDMPGRYESQIGSQLEAGVYRIELGGTTVDGLLTTGDVKKVETEIAVSSSKSTSELVELTADDTVPEQLAAATRGRVVAPIEAASLLEFLGPKSGSIKKTDDKRLWDRLPVLLLFLVIGSGEWILRKKAGLT
ncbi:MAG: hypothetical protein K8T91_12790 [Planctomycetes bacterium]|nr:hypothetical protein [Planctomycetota bacterium]